MLHPLPFREPFPTNLGVRNVPDETAVLILVKPNLPASQRGKAVETVVWKFLPAAGRKAKIDQNF
jgi:hypothetical protein